MWNAIKFFWPRQTSDRVLLVLAIIGFFASLYLLFFYRFDGSGSTAAKVGVLITETKVRRRHAKTLHWVDIVREGSIFLRDVVYVPKDTNAIVTLRDGRVLKLQPDSMVEFDEDMLDGIQITLFDFGLFRLMPFPKAKKLALLPDPRPLELLHAEVTDRLRQFLARQPRETLRTLGALAPLSCSDYKVVLLIPLEEKYNLKKHKWLNISWSPLPLPNITYLVQISRNANFREPISHTTKTSQIVVQFDDEGTYFWKVLAKCPVGTANSSVTKFTMSLKKGLEKAFTAEVARDESFYFIVKATVVQKQACPTEGLPRGRYFCRARVVSGAEPPKMYPMVVH